MIILGMRDSLLTSSNTTQWPAFRAASKGPSRQANSPPLPPSTGRSAPNRSVMSFEGGRSKEKPKLHKKLTRSQDSKSKILKYLGLVPLFLLIPKRELINPSTLYQKPGYFPKNLTTIFQVPINWSWSSKSVVLNCGCTWQLIGEL